MSTAIDNARQHAKELSDEAMLDQFATATRTIGPKTFNVEYIGNDVLEWWVTSEDGEDFEGDLAAVVNADQELTAFIAKHAYGIPKPLTSRDVTDITTSDDLEEWL